jgi:hypothetical protein
MDMEGGKPIFIIFLLLAGVVIALTAVVTFATQPDEPQQPIITPWPTLAPTPTLTPINASNVNVEGHNDTFNDMSYEAYQQIANSAAKNQTPNDHTKNLTGDSGVDYTRLAEMYPWYPDRYNDSSPDPWMWTPAKFSREYAGQGDAQRIQMYESWNARQVVKAPSIKLEILHNDCATPYDFNREALVLGHYYDGYFRFTNTGDKAFQGNVAVAINASLFFAGDMIHLENRIITDQYLSLYPGQTNDFYKKWLIKDFNGAPIPTGCLNIVIELRDLSDGRTISSLTIKPIVARDPNGDGILTF